MIVNDRTKTMRTISVIILVIQLARCVIKGKTLVYLHSPIITLTGVYTFVSQVHYVQRNRFAGSIF